MTELAPRPSLKDEPQHGIVSLWDMLNFHAAKFVEVLNTLTDVDRALTSDHSFLAGKGQMIAPTLVKQLSWLKSQTESLGLPVTAAAVATALYGAEHVAQYDAEQVGREMRTRLQDVRSRLCDELRSKYVFLVPAKDHIGGPGFGDVVSAAFPSAEYDIVEAHKCLTFARTTACVMHMMRVLELGLIALANDLGLKSKSDNWHSIIRSVQEEISARNKGSHGDSWKDVDEPFYSEAVAHFRVLKNAWRNHSMHARSKYTEEEAEEIYVAARSFMKHLSERLSEPEPSA